MMQDSEFTPSQPLNTAVLFIVFSRLETTKQVFEAIRQAKPPRLYLAADGPRENKEDEAEKVRVVREYVLENIDWECEVHTLFREENLGCKYAVSGSISWFFENEERGIILEDDCLPSQSFFWFCEELLERYKDNDSVFLVAGDGRDPDYLNMNEDYGFCKYPQVWGWASWARVWKQYSLEMEDWPEYRETLPSTISPSKQTQKFWLRVFEKMHNKQIDTWDYQFCFLLLKNQGKCIVPRLNLISNIGYGEGATHTHNTSSSSANRARFDFEFPLKHEINPKSEKRINNFYDKNYYFERKKRFRFKKTESFFKAMLRNLGIRK